MPYKETIDGMEFTFLTKEDIARNAAIAAAAPAWISVEERLPATNDFVVCWYRDTEGDYYPTIGSYGQLPTGEMCWTTDVDNNENAYPIDEITHWMPLPEPPNN